MLINTINSEISSLQTPWYWNQEKTSGIGFTKGNVWSRQTRRKRAQQQQDQQNLAGGQATSGTEHWQEITKDGAAFGFKIQIRQRGPNNDLEILIRWVKGIDSVLFESFCGMLKRKVEGR